MQAEQGQYRRTGSRAKLGDWSRSLCFLQPAGALCLLIIGSAILTGCSHLQLPAIDPYGNRIFLPLPNTTQLDLPHLHSHAGQPGLIPDPAFVAPPTPPPCLDAGSGVCNLFGHKHDLIDRLQTHFESPGKTGEIQLTPLRVVAPVGGEVVLLAGICGADGYLVQREPLEWMLSPDSVGTFIEVGDDRPGRLSNFLHQNNKVEKLDVDFARGRTSSKETLITRGTPNCEDDIRLRNGQTWLSVSSPSEGISRITVLAPESKIWDRRRLTSTIYWVDAQWEFPSPVIQRSGDTVQLVTRVTRAENLVPAENWIVQYTIVDPSIASFVPPTGSNQAQVRVNADAQAVVNIAANPDSRGTTPIIIDVIRPAQPLDNLPELVLGRGQTTVTFSAPGLNLEAFGPQVASIGEAMTFSAVVGNPGDVAAENVEIRAQIPAGTRLVNAIPQPTTQTPETLIWDQGALPANQQLDIAVVLEAQRANTISVLFQASGSGFPVRQRRVTTEIIEPAVEARFAPAGGVAEAEVGQTVLYEIDVTNVGRQTLTDLTVAIESDSGLPESSQGENRVEQTIPILQPGETRSIGISFRVQQTGQLGARLRVSSGQTILAERSTSIRGLEPRPRQPSIGVSIQFPQEIRVGSISRAIVTVQNPGEVRLTDIQVELDIDPSLVARRVDSANAPRIRLTEDGSRLTWSAQDLLPRTTGESGDIFRRLDVEFESRAPTQQGQLAVRATSAQGVQAQDAVQFRAAGAQAPRDVLPSDKVQPPPDGRQRTGELQVQLADYDDPTIVGRELRYNLFVINDRAIPDRNVRLLLRLPAGVELRSISREGNAVNFNYVEDRVIALPNIQFIRPDERIVFLIVIVPRIPSLLELQAQVSSDGQPQAYQTTETTTVTVR
jgi:uncharacterized repeat protein (TIGR01451 family)